MDVQAAEADQVVSLWRAGQVALVGCGFKPLPELQCMRRSVGACELVLYFCGGGNGIDLAQRSVPGGCSGRRYRSRASEDARFGMRFYGNYPLPQA